MLPELQQQQQHIQCDGISCLVFVLREFLWLHLWQCERCSPKVALYSYFDCHLEPRPQILGSSGLQNVAKTSLGGKTMGPLTEESEV